MKEKNNLVLLCLIVSITSFNPVVVWVEWNRTKKMEMRMGVTLFYKKFISTSKSLFNGV